MNTEPLELLLADDDKDDCFLFEDALKEIPVSTHLTTVRDGEKLMSLLAKKEDDALPDIIFLDLNMPRKNGFECLEEIKHDERLKELRVIIFSTSFREDIVDALYKNGAQHCMRKPREFSTLRKLIHNVIRLSPIEKSSQPAREKFMINDLS
jgi:CheY-like chemotaxis protein